MQKLLILIGIIFIVVGLSWSFITKLGLGKLPGDLSIETKNFKFYFPITTCIIISLIITLVLWLLKK
ncbi:MAG: DUF2905 domain-containing protein [Rickettsiales bacterium]|nr:DUF2905 domain-containing protein [Rickettsiales bacterium]